MSGCPDDGLMQRHVTEMNARNLATNQPQATEDKALRLAAEKKSTTVSLAYQGFSHILMRAFQTSK
jgi:hypothetical protein